MTRGAIRKALYFSVAIVAVAMWWFGGAGLFKSMADYVLGVSAPPARKVEPPPPPEPEPVAPAAPPDIVTLPLRPRPAPQPRPPPASPNPQFEAAKRYEAAGDVRNAWLTYLGASTIPGPYVEDSLLGVVRMLIAGGPIHKHASVCAMVKSLRTQFPVPRPDLAEQTTTTLAAANCEP